jgi:hypothetical protein
MAIGDPSFRYAVVSYLTDGVETDWEVSFSGGYISEDHVSAYSVLVDPETELETDRTPHTLEFLSPGEVRISPAVSAGRKLYIFRDTPKTNILVSFLNGKVLNKANLDLANRQAIYGIAELVDALVSARIVVDQQTGNIINLQQIITEIYNEVLELLAAGGIVSVAPRVWTFAFNGDDVTFPIVGADVEAPGFYDVYVDGAGLQPTAGYIVEIGEDVADSTMTFTEVHADGLTGFAVLRGYAKPYVGAPPVTDLRLPLIDVPDAAYFVDKDSEFSVLRCSNAGGCDVTIKTIPAESSADDEMSTGSYFSATQRGAGQVEFIADVDVNFVIPDGLTAKTRAVGSTISAYCENAASNTWVLSGDLEAA